MAWHKVMEERERIFYPNQVMVGEDVVQLSRERSQSLAQLYLTNAWAVVSSDRVAAWENYCRAFREDLRQALHPKQLGLIRRMAVP
jgi:hypothetical protein